MFLYHGYKSASFTESQGSYNAQSIAICNDKPGHLTVLLHTYPISLMYFSCISGS